MISQRALSALSEPSPLVVAHFESAKNRFHPTSNPQGAINLGTAENHLMGSEMLDWLNKKLQLSERDLHYAEFRGTEELRKILAKFLHEVSAIPGASANNVVIGNGVSSLLESLAFSLFDPGDSIIIPAPYYTGYGEDFNHRFGVKIIPAAMRLDNDFALDIEIVEEVYTRAVQQGETVKAILVNNPNNPLGKHYPRDQLERLIDFAMQNRLQIISDEIYAHSIYDNAHGDYVSLLTLGQRYKNSIHVLYGLAKDFGLSGFKFGLCYSENADLVKALASNAYFYNVSTLTQYVISHLFADLVEARTFIQLYKPRLRQAYDHMLSVNRASLNVPILPAQGGHFVFMQLSPNISSHAQELDLYHHLWRQAEVNITPGQFFCCQSPGWFRVCFANQAETVTTAFARIAKAMKTC